MAMQLSESEKQYIAENCTKLTDEEIAKHLERDIRTIINYRRKTLGIHKKAGGQLAAISLDAAKDILIPTTTKLEEHQRANFFRIQIKNTLYYDLLKKQFSEDELNYYIEEYGALCVQFEDILATEVRQIDEFIKASIMGNRILEQVKRASDEAKAYESVLQEMQKNREPPEDATEEQKEEYNDNLQLLMTVVANLSGQASAMSKTYDDIVERKSSLMEGLNARRKDRVENINKKGITFLNLVEMFRDKKVRETQGKLMELVKLASEKKEREWRDEIVFPDGQKGHILVDEGTSEIMRKQKESDSADAHEMLDKE